MLDYAQIASTPAEPEATSMIETFRAIGYSIETAVADIIDNSISAGAKNIWVDYEWNGPDTQFWIMDDGLGMNNEDIIQAMRPGSINPLETRKKHDLGRFGLGLKTASFSQCRKFCVVSKTNTSDDDFWSWDLDFVNEVKSWRLIKYCPEETKFIKTLSALESGTIVIWWDIDRLTKGSMAESESSKSKFLETMDNVKKHLAMVFHRFLEDGLTIYFRDRKIKAWDPFMFGAEGLQSRPEMVLGNGDIKVKGFVLPHRSKLSPDEYESGKGPKDSWTAHQGFYVYRNKRLLVAGDWLGLFKREVHYDLCRIMIDLPNTYDGEWQIDIKKSIARPPLKYRDQILSVAKDVRNQAVEVYRHKGKVLRRKLSTDEFFPLWEERARHGKRFYKVNRTHPLIEEVFSKAGPLKIEIEKLLQFVEETVPVPLITLQESEHERPHGQPFEGIDHNALKETLKKLFESMVNSGVSPDKARMRILNMEPFSFFPEYFDQLDHG